MKIEVEERGDVQVVSVEGSLDAHTAPDLGRTFTSLLESGHFNLVADLAGVDYTSSAGLRVLLTAMKQTRQNDGDLRLAGVQVGVRKVLDMAGLTSAVRLYPDVEQAVTSFQQA